MTKRRARKLRLEEWLNPDGTRMFSDKRIAEYEAARARLEAYVEKRSAPTTSRRP